MILNLVISVAALGLGLAAYCWYRWQQLRNQVTAQAAVQRRNEAIVDASGEGVLELDASGHVCFANPTAIRLLGYETEELQGLDYRKLLSAGELPDSGDTGRIGYTTDMLRGIGAILRCKGGRNRPIEYRMVPLRQNGTAASLIAFRDLTERSRIDVMLADMQHMARVGAWELSIGSARLNISEGISRRLHLSGTRVAALGEVLKALSRDSRVRLLHAARTAIATGTPFDLELNLQGQPDDWLRCIGKPERVDGTSIRLYGALQDITELKQAERMLRETRDFFGATLNAMPALVLHINQQEALTYCNQSPLRAVVGLDADCVGQAMTQVFNKVRHADLLRGIRRALQGRASSMVRPLSLADQYRQIHCSFVPQQQGCLLVLGDVTELKVLEARLHQAEKMQAVGQLTGGLAHDFNNLLGVVLGNLQLIERDVDHDPAIARKLATAMRAAMRGTELTKRLLSFARRQVLEPVSIDIGQQLRVFAELIQRTLGDSVDMQLDLPEGLWRARVDLGQFENAILNLVINSRDAMPAGGRLTVAARNFRPDATFLREHADLQSGDYVEISVSDTGSGIPAQVLSRVFEPFFTTKEVGKGSGLGLSMVHGFAKQSGGTVQVHSEPGPGLNQGTRIGIVLPRCNEAEDSHVDTLIRKAMPGGTESILVVEDDTDLRATTVLALQQLGYQVLDASTGEAALKLLAEGHPVDVLFTDIIMPGGMLGPELANRARSSHPAIRVLLTTGYLGDPGKVQPDSMSQEALLAKPYRNEDLAMTLRTLLD